MSRRLKGLAEGIERMLSEEERRQAEKEAAGAFVPTAPAFPPDDGPNPNFVAVKSSSQSSYLTLDYFDKTPYVTFSSAGRAKLATHAIFYTLGKDIAIFRGPNGRYWRRNSSGWIVADFDKLPTRSDKACQFQVVKSGSDIVGLRSLVDDLYLTVSQLKGKSAYKAESSETSEKTQVAIEGSSDTALSFPSYVAFKGINQKYVRVESNNWLRFAADNPTMDAGFQVVPLLDGNVIIRSVTSNKFWRLSSGWILSDTSSEKDAQANRDCQFEIFKLGPQVIGIRSIANNRFIKHFTADGRTDSLNARIGDPRTDLSVPLTVSALVGTRNLTNIKYLTELAEVKDHGLVVLGEGSEENRSAFKADLAITVSVTKAEETWHMWSTEDKIGGTLSMTFYAGVPEIASASLGISVTKENTKKVEDGKKKTQTVVFQASFTVKDVPGNTKVTVKVECNMATCRVPFTYVERATLPNGVAVPPVERVDGIFEGLNAFDIKGVISDGQQEVQTSAVLQGERPVVFLGGRDEESKDVQQEPDEEDDEQEKVDEDSPGGEGSNEGQGETNEEQDGDDETGGRGQEQVDQEEGQDTVDEGQIDEQNEDNERDVIKEQNENQDGEQDQINEQNENNDQGEDEEQSENQGQEIGQAQDDGEEQQEEEQGPDEQDNNEDENQGQEIDEQNDQGGQAQDGEQQHEEKQGPEEQDNNEEEQNENQGPEELQQEEEQGPNEQDNNEEEQNEKNNNEEQDTNEDPDAQRQEQMNGEEQEVV